jgi:predicted hotdog family 3-hydroxylacyl-ACP dehydratase
MTAPENIHLLIPQKPPFVMVDRLLHADESRATSIFRVRAENIFVVNGKLLEAGLVENIAQTAAARAGHISSVQKKIPVIGYIGDVKNLEIAGLPKINDELETEITIEKQIFEVSFLKGRISCGKKEIARCEMKLFISQPK